MPHFARFILVNVSRETVFDFLADYRNIPRFQPQFQTVRPVTAVTRGLGATLDLRGSFLGLPIAAQMHIVGFEPPHLLVSESSSGVRSHTTWRLTAVPPVHPETAAATTRAHLTVDYEITLPGLGRLVGGLLQHEIEELTVQSLKRLKMLLEGHPLPD
jgi:hypothetical protein